jgi:hypothetical protein
MDKNNEFLIKRGPRSFAKHSRQFFLLYFEKGSFGGKKVTLQGCSFLK